MLSAEERRSVIKYRIEKAYQVLGEARDNARLGHWNLAGNRLYYSLFHIVQALMLDKGIEARSHGGTIHMLGAKFITAGLLDRAYGRLMSRLYELRQSGDYDDMFDATEEEIVPYFSQVEDMLKDVEALITFK